jgi:hypothetical protein
MVASGWLLNLVVYDGDASQGIAIHNNRSIPVREW